MKREIIKDTDAQKIKNAIASSGKTRREFAKLLGRSYGSFSGILRGFQYMPQNFHSDITKAFSSWGIQIRF